MLFNAQKPLLNRDGEEIKDESGQVVTLGSIALIALDMPPAQGEPPVSANEKYRRFLLQSKMYKATEAVEISAEDAALIKKMVAAVPHFPLLFVGRVIEEIEKS